MDDVEKSVLCKIKETYGRAKNNHDDMVRVEALVQEAGNMITQMKKELGDIASFIRVSVASQISIAEYLPFKSDDNVVSFFTREKGETKEDLKRRQLGFENYLRVSGKKFRESLWC
jgi:hypothetical protein